MKVSIFGTEYECRPLGAAKRLRWNLYLQNECWRTFYSDLYERIEHIPTAIQQVIMQKHSPPARLDASMALYYQVASTPQAVRVLVEMVVQGDPPEVTKENAIEILLDLKHLIFTTEKPVLIDTKEKQAAALETFAAMENHNARNE